MAEIKTKKNNANVVDFLNAVESEQKRNDSFKLLAIFEKITKEKATMWGDSIVGFGSYHYKSEKSKQEGEWLLTGFSPRKQNISIYIIPGFSKFQEVLKDLGKFKISSGSCLYLKKLEEIDINLLKQMIADSVKMMKQSHQIN